jgi:hypothetical protein
VKDLPVGSLRRIGGRDGQPLVDAQSRLGEKQRVLEAPDAVHENGKAGIGGPQGKVVARPFQRRPASLVGPHGIAGPPHVRQRVAQQQVGAALVPGQAPPAEAVQRGQHEHETLGGAAPRLRALRIPAHHGHDLRAERRGGAVP